jgi:predicted GNAT family acetyltransferase
MQDERCRMSDAPVTRNVEHDRFEVTIDGSAAFLEYHLKGDRLVLVHTEVPAELEGRGVGGLIVRAALDYAREQGLTVVPRCPFVKSYLERHPDEAERVKTAGA